MDSDINIHALFEYATEGILIVDSVGKIVKINPSAEKLFGYNAGELIGKSISCLIPDKFKKSHDSYHTNYMKNPHARAMGSGIDLFGKKKDGKDIPIEISLSPYEVSGNSFVIAFIIDITERRKVQEKIKTYSVDLERQVKDRTLILQDAVNQLEKTKEELKEALNKERELNNMKSRFVSMASHEFRTPLATILSSLSLISKYSKLNEEEKKSKHILRIKSAVTNMTEILNDFLSLGKLEEGKINVSLEYFDIMNFIKDVVQEMQLNVKKGQTIYFKSTEEKSFVELDKKLLKNILFNLLSNAIKFSEENKSIKVVASIKNEKIHISISDQGIGISEEDQQYLFERFFRGHNAINIQGTGLGLNIVMKYIELLDGKITFESKLNSGTTFNIILPIVKQNIDK